MRASARFNPYSDCGFEISDFGCGAMQNGNCRPSGQKAPWLASTKAKTPGWRTRRYIWTWEHGTYPQEAVKFTEEMRRGCEENVNATW